jgi:antitoxin StbD
VTELKMNPMKTVESAAGEPIAILNRNRPAFYCIPTALYETMMEQLDDAELARLIQQREHSREIEVSPDDL